jgi:hypothetical protein
MKSHIIQSIEIILIIISLCLVSCGKKAPSNTNTKENNDSLPVKNENILTYEDSIQSLINKNKLHLDSVFVAKRNLSEFKEYTELGEIMIGDLFSTKQKYAVI